MILTFHDVISALVLLGAHAGLAVARAACVYEPCRRETPEFIIGQSSVKPKPYPRGRLENRETPIRQRVQDIIWCHTTARECCRTRKCFRCRTRKFFRLVLLDKAKCAESRHLPAYTNETGIVYRNSPHPVRPRGFCYIIGGVHQAPLNHRSSKHPSDSHRSKFDRWMLLSWNRCPGIYLNEALTRQA